MNNWDIVEEIWGHSNGHFVTVGSIDRTSKRFSEFVYDRREIWAFPKQAPNTDLYFSVLSFNQQARRNDHFAGASLLFADLDPVDPHSLVMPPSIAWETSPGNYQAVWFLTKFIEDYQRWSELNHRMTVTTKADSGGWAASKLLRVPESLNFKRAVKGFVPRGRVVIHAPVLRYNPKTLEGVLEQAGPALTVGEGPLPSTVGLERLPVMRELWPRLGIRARWMLSSRCTVYDRSFHIVKTIKELRHHSDLTSEEIFQVIVVQPWNKFRYRPERLWSEVCRYAD